MASPTLQGCTAVLPTLSQCSANPLTPGCAVTTDPIVSTPNSPLDTALRTTIDVLQTATKIALLDGDKQEKKDDNSSVETSTVTGEKKNEAAKKLYCN